MFKSLILSASILMVSVPAFAQSNPPIKCRDGFEWNPEKKMCLPVRTEPSKPSTTKPTTRPSGGNGDFCDQYPQDPMCGGNIPKPVAPPKR